MNLVENTINLLDIDPLLVVKDATNYSEELTVYDVISTIINGEGQYKLDVLFKGHTMPKIRSILSMLFMDYPKKSHASEWYLHILCINGLKKCPHCKNIKELSGFSANKAMRSSGVDSWCLSCKGEYRKANTESLKITKANHQKANPEQYAASSAKRRAAKKNAIPVWSDLNEIKSIYEKCPEGYHVDHWAPLQGENVCGLHVPENLQYLPASFNISKGNKFLDSDPYYGY